MNLLPDCANETGKKDDNDVLRSSIPHDGLLVDRGGGGGGGGGGGVDEVHIWMRIVSMTKHHIFPFPINVFFFS